MPPFKIHNNSNPSKPILSQYAVLAIENTVTFKIVFCEKYNLTKIILSAVSRKRYYCQILPGK